MSARRADFWTPQRDCVVHCLLCPHECQIPPGKSGRCCVRTNNGGELQTLAYAKASGFSVDPIEKKPLYHFLCGSQTLSFGTIGCNLSCRFCQNWQIASAKDASLLDVAAIPDEIARKALSLRTPSVSFTYNEPVIFAEQVMVTAEACHQLGIKTVVVSNGYISDKARPEFFRNIDAVNIDLKSFNDKFYKRLCAASLEPVLDTLLFLKKTGIWFEITTLLIPGENDSDHEVKSLSSWIVRELGKDVPLHFSAFHPSHLMLDHPRTSISDVCRARQIARDAGLSYVYTGNVKDELGSTTYCPSCRKAVIIRDGYQVTEFHTKQGCCDHCQERIAGVYA